MIPTLLVALAGCASPGDASGSTRPPLLTVEDAGAIELDAVLPSDVLARPDGSWWVLDGYGGRILAYGADGKALPDVVPKGLPRAARLSPAADGGVWASVPGRGDVTGQLVHLDAQGQPDAVHVPLGADDTPLRPVDVLDTGKELVVAERTGGLAWVDPTTDKVTRTVLEDEKKVRLKRVVDLAADHDGRFALVDALGPKVHRVGADGAADEGFGHQGLAVGRMARPSSVDVYAGDLLVADSVLGVVQAFQVDGALVGALAEGTEPLRFGHPVAVRAGDKGMVAVLEAEPARLHIVRLPATLPAAPPPTIVRTELLTADLDVAGQNGQNCLQCHDGLVNDSREIWDPARKHHPVGMVPDEPLPAFFPVDEKGRMTCITCHSPHGVVDSADSATGAAPLVRHLSDTSPFTRLDKDSDKLCLACHTADKHVSTGVATVDAAQQGHPTGAGLLAALNARKARGVEPSDPTKATCLSCHAMHGATGSPILRDPNDGKTCLGCHPDKGETATNHPLGRVAGKDLRGAEAKGHVVLSGEGGVGCLSCHDLASDRSVKLLRSASSQRPICLDCHNERKDLAGSPHAQLSHNGLPTCVNCHDVHGGKRDETFLALSPKTPGDPTACLSCHAPGGRGATARATPGRAGHPVDARTVPAHDGQPESKLTCLSCHDAHEANKPVARDCETCHDEQAAGRKAGGHGKADCLDCHAPHSGKVLAQTGDNPVTERCLACHGPGGRRADAPKLASWKHPVALFLPDGTRWQPLGDLTLYDKDGKALPSGQNGEMTCQTCHAVHGPVADGGDKLRKPGHWKDACAACHSDDAIVMYKYFHQPERRADLTEGTR